MIALSIIALGTAMLLAIMAIETGKPVFLCTSLLLTLASIWFSVADLMGM